MDYQVGESSAKKRKTGRSEEERRRELHAILVDACKRRDNGLVTSILEELYHWNPSQRNSFLDQSDGEAVRAALPEGGRTRFEAILEDSNEGTEILEMLVRAGADPNVKSCSITNC